MSKLREAYELIKDKESWCQGWVALDELESIVEPNSEEAVRWCAIGAVMAVYNIEDDLTIALGLDAPSKRDWEKINHISQEMFHKTGIEVNDTMGHEYIMQVFEKAIISEEGGL